MGLGKSAYIVSRPMHSMLSDRETRFMWKGCSILYFTEQSSSQYSLLSQATLCCGCLSFTVKPSLCLTEGAPPKVQSVAKDCVGCQVTVRLLSFAAGYVASFPFCITKGVASLSCCSAQLERLKFVAVLSSRTDPRVPVVGCGQNKLSSAHKIPFIYLYILSFPLPFLNC